MTAADPLIQFQAALAETPEAWHSIDVRSIALKDGAHVRNLYTVVHLDSADAAGHAEILAETPSLLSVRERFPYSILFTLLHRMGTGALTVAERTVGFGEVVAVTGGARGLYRASPPLLSQPIGEFAANVTYRIGHRLYLRGGDASDTSLAGGREQLDRELRAAAIPWDGLEALCQFGLGVTHVPELGQGGLVVVIAPLGARLYPERSWLKDGTLHAEVELGDGRLSSSVTVGYVTTAEGELVTRGSTPVEGPRSVPSSTRTIASSSNRARRSGKQSEPHRELHRESRSGTRSSHILAHANVVIDSVARGASMFLRVGPYVVDRRELVDDDLRSAHPLLSAYEQVDPELTLLSAWLLAPRQSEQVEFERAIGRLLTFVGFTVDSFAGDKRLSDAPDIIAYDAESRVVLVLECTTGPLQSKEGKLSKLVTRANTIRSALSGASAPHVLAAIATPLAAADIAESDRASAQADGLTILDNQTLAALLALARAGRNPSAAFSLIRHRSLGGKEPRFVL